MMFPDQTGERSFDWSSADLALCHRLAYWTKNDRDLIDRYFRQSGLMREKWNRSDYRNSTIEAAVSANNGVEFGKVNSKRKPVATLENLRALLNTKQIELKYNLMTQSEEIEIPGYCENDINCKITHIVSLCTEHGMATGAVPSMLDEIASHTKYHPALEWIRSEPWDGV